MKKLVYTLAMVALGMQAQAQTTVITEKDGKVGVGTSSPASKLHVHYSSAVGEISKNGLAVTRHTQTTGNVTSHDKGISSSIGNFSISSGATDLGYKIGVDASSYASTTNFKGTLRSNYGVWARAGIHKAIAGAKINYAAAIEAEVLDNVAGTTIENAYGIKISTNNYKKATVNNRYDVYASTGAAKNYFAGTVGIGTNSPTSGFKLDVNGSVKLDATSSNHTNLQLGHDAHDRIFADNSQDKYYGGGMFFRVTPDPSLNIAHNYIDAMILSDKGEVGIGVRDTKGFRLGVNGKIAATEVKIAKYDNWRDFVFAKDYNLPTLKEVESHIKEKGHLKDIPSAEEVKKNGFFLGEMDANLLQKIEELTLYTIQQEKQLKKQSEELNELKKLVKQLVKVKK